MSLYRAHLLAAFSQSHSCRVLNLLHPLAIEIFGDGILPQIPLVMGTCEKTMKWALNEEIPNRCLSTVIKPVSLPPKERLKIDLKSVFEDFQKVSDPYDEMIELNFVGSSPFSKDMLRKARSHPAEFSPPTSHYCNLVSQRLEPFGPFAKRKALDRTWNLRLSCGNIYSLI